MPDFGDHMGILITNLGSPTSTNLSDIKKYLTAFLMDERVIDIPKVFRSFLVKVLIVPKRAPKTAQSYKKIWRPEGSPLIIYSKKLKEKIQQKTDIPVALCMRYGEPSTEKAFEELLARDPDIQQVTVLPLYPQYTMSSFDTAVESLKKIHRERNYKFKLKFLNPFYNHPDYIASLAATIKPFIEKGYDKLLFSYHGIPVRHLGKDEKRIASGKADFNLPPINYQQQAIETSRLTAEALHIPKEKYETSFQSRLSAAGKTWLTPYTVKRLSELPGEGVKKLLVVCPAFINDCLETIEEIGMEGKETFENAGGESLTLIPCINDQDQFAETVIKWASEGQLAL